MDNTQIWIHTGQGLARIGIALNNWVLLLLKGQKCVYADGVTFLAGLHIFPANTRRYPDAGLMLVHFCDICPALI